MMSDMTFREKIQQLTVASVRPMCDLQELTVKESARELHRDGAGFVTHVGGSNDLTPPEVARLTNRIQRFFVEETAHGIPVIFRTEATSGTLARNHTVFPGNLNLGAAFNPELVQAMADAIRKEMIVVGERYALAPVVDLVRDFRYGRCEESYSEDVYLTALNGISVVKGLQGKSLSEGIATTLKHFAGQGMNDGGRNTCPVHLGERELLDEYLVAFEACIQEAEPATIMAAYHELDGIPCHASRALLQDVLRGRLAYEGVIVSDGSGLRQLKDFQEYCRTYKDAARTALKAGIQVERGEVYKDHLEELVSEEPELGELVDSACRQVLELKQDLGLFENPYVDEERVGCVVHCPEHVALSRELAQESIVLLKNDGPILPLNPRQYDTIAVVGPLADEIDIGYGDYSYPTHIREMLEENRNISEEEAIARSIFAQVREPEYLNYFNGTKTLLETLRARLPEKRILHARGLKDTYNFKNVPGFREFDDLRRVAEEADVIIACCGDRSGMGGSNDSGESVDRVDITLPKEQLAMLEVLASLGKPLILVLTNGRPFSLTRESEQCEAIVESFRAGECSADAIVDVLLGDCNPSGRLPVTLPKHVGQCPVYYGQRITGHRQFWRDTYLEMDLLPLYEFGHGLSYSTFHYDAFRCSVTNDGIQISFTVTNTSEVAGAEVPQVYVAKRFGSVAQPERELRAFAKVHLEAGETATVSGTIAYDSLGYHNVDMELVLENCDATVHIGASCRRIHHSQTFSLSFEDGRRSIARRIFSNPLRVRKEQR